MLGRPAIRILTGFCVTFAAVLALVACTSAEPTPAPRATAPAAPPAAASPTSAPVATPMAATATAAPATQPGAPTGTLTVALIKLGAPTGLASKQTGGAPEQLSKALGITERLAERQHDLSFKPMLAESYALSDDLKTLTVRLRRGVQFHGGYGEMTAEDVKWSYGEAGVENPESIHGSVGYLRNYFDPLRVVDNYTVELPIKQFTIGWEDSYLRCWISTASGSTSRSARTRRSRM